MSVRTDIVNLQVNINGDKGKNELTQLRKRAAELTTEMRGLKKSTTEYKQKAEELRQINGQMDALRKSIGLTALSQKELVKELDSLKQQRSLVTPQTKEFGELSKRINDVSKRLTDVRNGTFGFKSAMGSVSKEIKQFGVLAASYLGFEFITSQTKNLIRMQADMAREMADIRKTTGLDETQVKALNDELRKIDTASSTSSLRKIAVEAGKLGIEGAANIKKFVQEADQIQIALGEDLGEEGLLKIAKLSGILKEEMIKVASGINAVGAASAASESYQVDFAFRMAGAAQTAKIAAGDLLGFASALEVNGQTAEVSGTAMSMFMLNFIKNADQFGKSAGMAGGELSKMINEKGVNEAMLTWLQRLKDGTATQAEFIAKMNDLGIDGARGAGVFLVLANNIDLVRQQQQLANQAISEGTSVVDEFAIRNQSFDAVVKRLQKSFNSFFTSDSINGFVKSLVFGLENLLTIIRNVSDFVSRNSTAFKMWTLAVLLQVGVFGKLFDKLKLVVGVTKEATNAQVLAALAERAAIVWTSALGAAKALLTLNIKKLVQEWRLMSAAMGLNPFTALLLVIGAVVLAYKEFTSEVRANQLELKGSLAIQAQVNEQMSETMAKEQMYLGILRDRTASEDVKKKVLQDLIAINPAYLGTLTSQNVLTAQGTEIINNYNNMLRRKMQLEASAAQSQAAYQDYMKQQGLAYQAQMLQQRSRQGESIKTSDLPDELKSAYSRTGNAATSLLNRGAMGMAGLFGLDVDGGNIDEIVRNQQKIADKAKKNFDAMNGLNSKMTSAAVKTVNQQLQSKKLLLHELKNDSRSSKEAIAKAKQEVDNLQAEYDQLTGAVKAVSANNLAGGNLPPDTDKKTKSGGGGGAKQRLAEMQRIKDEIEKVKMQAEMLSAKATENNKAQYDLEVQQVVEKYQKLTAEAAKYAIDIAGLSEAQAKELEALWKNYFSKQSEEEYDAAKQNLEKYYQEQRNIAAQSYADGITDKQAYTDAIKSIDAEELQARITNANDYKANVPKAAEDAEALKTKALDQGIKDREDREKQAEEDQEKKKRARLAAMQAQVMAAADGSQAELNARLAYLQAKYEAEIDYEKMTAEEIALIHMQRDEEMKATQQSFLNEKINQFTEYANAVSSILSSVFQIIANNENAELEADKERNESKKRNLDKQLDQKKISRAEYDKRIAAMDAAYEKKEKELKARQAKREKAMAIFNAVINTAAAVAKALTAGPYIGVVLAALTAAMGAVQIAAISSQSIPKARRGAILQGPSHEGGGVTLYDANGMPVVEAEGGEPVAVFSKRTYANNKPIIDQLMYSSQFRNGAPINQPLPFNMQRIMPALERGGYVTNATATANTQSLNTQNSELMALVMEMVNEQKQMKETMAAMPTELKARVVLTDLHRAEAKLRKAKELGGG